MSTHASTMLARPRAQRIQHQPTGLRRATVELPGTSVGAAASRPRSWTLPGRPDEDLLARNELDRLRGLAYFILAIVPVIFLGLDLFRGDATAAAVHRVGLAVDFAGAVWFLLRVRRPADCTPARVLVFSHTSALGITSGIYFWGLLSAMLMFLPFGSLVLNQGRSLAASVSVTVVTGLIYVALAVLIVTGALPDRAVVPLLGTGAYLIGKLAGLTIVVVVLLASTWLGWVTRAANMRAAAERDAALYRLAQREVQLAEVHAELDELCQPIPGPYTDVVLGEFVLGLMIGRGGMSEVYEGRHRNTGELAAVKLLHAHHLARPDAFRRFVREARILASLCEPHVVRVLDLPRDGETIPFIAMELLSGRTLASHLQVVGRMPLDEVVELVSQVGLGLQAAHDAGVVHRDLKPQNLFCTTAPDGARLWKILDFGVCKQVDTGPDTTIHGQLIGTPAFMSPEQARGLAVDARTDLHALGAIAYRALTGHPPFSGGSLRELLTAVSDRIPAAPSRILPELPEAVDAVFARALAKAPAERYPCAAELAAALATAASRGRISGAGS